MFLWKSKEQRDKEERTLVWKKFIMENHIPCVEGTEESDDVWNCNITAPEISFYCGYPPIEEAYIKSYPDSEITGVNKLCGFYIWGENDNIILMESGPGSGNLGRFTLAKKNIISYRVEGNDYYFSKIEGGGGGGTSISGAIIGGMLAGEVGAIIGSRKEINEIKSSTENIDKRRTEVKYLYNDKEIDIYFDGTMYDQLKGILPKKDLNYLITQKVRESSFTEGTEENVYEKIKLLNKLKEDGLITVTEYQIKKENVLSRL